MLASRPLTPHLSTLNSQPSRFVPTSKSQARLTIVFFLVVRHNTSKLGLLSLLRQLNSFSECSQSSTTQLLTLNPQLSTLNSQPSRFVPASAM